ncbi:TAP42-like protein [Kipferlia bialata]|uniref:TAP42-like protein n=1 Tax=Kipferlia bialata TaxID=797122 RepID=A0A9K3CXK0_9EUKA|nr:TAP42-like protein [Kipferlia bialata]|eukprot:g6828.t1
MLKREKAASAALDEISRRKAECGMQDDEYEEVERQFWIQMLNIAMRKSVDEMKHLKQEAEILKFVRERPQEAEDARLDHQREAAKMQEAMHAPQAPKHSQQANKGIHTILPSGKVIQGMVNNEEMRQAMATESLDKYGIRGVLMPDGVPLDELALAAKDELDKREAQGQGLGQVHTMDGQVNMHSIMTAIGVPDAPPDPTKYEMNVIGRDQYQLGGKTDDPSDDELEDMHDAKQLQERRDWDQYKDENTSV